MVAHMYVQDTERGALLPQTQYEEASNEPKSLTKPAQQHPWWRRQKV